jgi:alcohol dehydrogenase class IV
VPDLVILDPCLTVSLPTQITATTGLDALVHAIEACTCRQRNTISDALGLHAIRLVSENLVTAIEAPEDLNARSGMLIASTLAGSAFSQTGSADGASTAFSRLVDQTGMSRSLAEKAIDPDTLAELMMSAENLPMAENNARPISKGDASYLARRTLGVMGRKS